MERNKLDLRGLAARKLSQVAHIEVRSRRQLVLPVRLIAVKPDDFAGSGCSQRAKFSAYFFSKAARVTTFLPTSDMSSQTCADWPLSIIFNIWLA